MTVEGMLSDYWAHHYHDNPKAQEEYEDPDFEAEFAEMMADSNDWEELN